MPFRAYLAELQNNLRSGQATEPSYYPALKSLVKALDPSVGAPNKGIVSNQVERGLQ